MLDLTSILFTGGPLGSAESAASLGQAAGGIRAANAPRPGLSARTTVVTLRARREAVFNLLADIENLPRWAPEFCERVSIVEGRWVALTSCGELYLALEAREADGEILLSAGENRDELQRFALTVTQDDLGQARVRFPLAKASSVTGAEIYARLEAALRELTVRVGRMESAAGA